jgi:small subunit ribosomal protein S21
MAVAVAAAVGAVTAAVAADVAAAAAVTAVAAADATNGWNSNMLPEAIDGSGLYGGLMPLRMRVHDREPIGAALRRFKKLLERSGMQKELRKRKHYEKPSEIRRRAEMRRQKAIKTRSQPRPMV